MRVIAEQLLGERRVVRPVPHAVAGGEQCRQLAGSFVAERHEINRLPPLGRFLGAPSGHHLAHDSRQQSGSVLPADPVEALERLVDEVERVACVGERPLGRRREQGVGECRRQGAEDDGRLRPSGDAPALRGRAPGGREGQAAGGAQAPSRRACGGGEVGGGCCSLSVTRPRRRERSPLRPVCPRMSALALDPHKRSG
jgi:hypothetical protein